MRPSVLIAVSGHGYGHSVRCAEVASALLARGARVLVRTEAPRWLFPREVEWIAPGESPLDIGVAQHDGLDMDIDETRRRWTCFADVFYTRADAEAQTLKARGVDVVLGDIPPLAFAAAARAGLASIAVTNFGWDWIYSVWPGFDDIVRLIQNAYAEADVLLRLPLSARSPEAFQAFERIEDVPLIARRAHRPRESVRAALGFSSEARVVLVSFGAFTARGLDLQALGRCTGYAFVVTPPLAVNNLPGNVVALNETPSDYVSLLAACDVVITKPGYGIVADCLANRVAVLFTDRGPFREYDVLADALPRLGRARYIPRSDLFGGDLSEHLEALFASRAPWTDMPMNGADVVASRALSIVSNLKR